MTTGTIEPIPTAHPAHPVEPACYSRATIFQVNGSASVANLLRQDLPGYFSFWGGSIDRLSDGDVEFDSSDPFNNGLFPDNRGYRHRLSPNRMTDDCHRLECLSRLSHTEPLSWRDVAAITQRRTISHRGTHDSRRFWPSLEIAFSTSNGSAFQSMLGCQRDPHLDRGSPHRLRVNGNVPIYQPHPFAHAKQTESRLGCSL